MDLYIDIYMTLDLATVTLLVIVVTFLSLCIIAGCSRYLVSRWRE